MSRDRHYEQLLRFTLTSEHVRLLRHFYVGWQDCETGAPKIDPKRPYGNSDVEDDVIELLQWPMTQDADAMKARAFQLHRETEIALQIVLRLGSFEPGTFERSDWYGASPWRRVP